MCPNLHLFLETCSEYPRPCWSKTEKGKIKVVYISFDLKHGWADGHQLISTSIEGGDEPAQDKMVKLDQIRPSQKMGGLVWQIYLETI